MSRRDGNAEIYVMNADGSAQENLTRQPASDSHPSWSRDGRKLVFVSRRDGNSEIYVMNADGSGLRNLTRTPSDDLDPAWSPDGRTIAFVQKKCVPSRPCGDRLRDVPLRRECRRERAAATDDTPGRMLFNPSWSADGKTIRYGRSLVHADGSGPQRAAEERPARRSVVARRAADRLVSVAHSRAEARNPTKLGLWVMNADGSNARRVAAKATGGPAWSPDGRRIAFRRFNGKIGPARPSDLFVVNADGSGLRRLTRHAENMRWFAWSPDGRTIAYLRNREVYIVKADGSAERRLTQLDK